MNQHSFLSTLNPRPLNTDLRHGLVPVGLHLGKGDYAIEIAVAKADTPPNRASLVDFWKEHRDRRPTPVLAVVLHPDGASFCGATGVHPPDHMNAEEGQVERLCMEVLDQPDRHAALRFLASAIESLTNDLPGIRNAGLVSMYYLIQNVPQHKDWNWDEAGNRARTALGKRNVDLLSALGFKIKRLDSQTNILSYGEKDTAVAVMLRETESAEVGAERFNSLSPVSYALSKADSKRLSWVVLVQGNRIRIYPTKVNSGVGRGGRTETYVECMTSLVADKNVSYLWLLCSAEALAPPPPPTGSLGHVTKAWARLFANQSTLHAPLPTDCVNASMTK